MLRYIWLLTMYKFWSAVEAFCRKQMQKRCKRD